MSYPVIIIKPDAFERNLVLKILSRLLEEFDIEFIYTLTPSRSQWKDHYCEHMTKEFFPNLINAMSDKKVILFIPNNSKRLSLAELKGHKLEDDALVMHARNFCENIRAEFVDTDYVGPRNLIHCSDSKESAEREYNYWINQT